MRERFSSRSTRTAASALMAGAVATALATSGLPAWAASQKAAPAANQNKMTETITVSGGWASPEMEKLAESSGRFLLHRLDAADDLIKAGDYKVAHKELDGAMDTAGAIKAMMPFLTVADQIKNAKNKLVVEGTDFLRDDLLPVYGQLDEMSLFAPDVAFKAKQHVEAAEEKAEAGKKAEAVKNLSDAIETITATTLYLPIDYVYDQVAAARTALFNDAPDAKTAQRAVENARSSLVAVVTTVEGHPQS